MKKYLTFLFGLVFCVRLTAQEKEVDKGLCGIVEEDVIDSVDCSAEYFMKDVYVVDFGFYVDGDRYFAVYGDVPEVWGKVIPIELSHKQIDGEDYTVYHFTWQTESEEYGNADVEYSFSWHSPVQRFEAQITTNQGKKINFKGRLYRPRGKSMETSQDSTEVVRHIF